MPPKGGFLLGFSMLVTIAPSISQITWYAQSALGRFDTLDIETAAGEAQEDLKALLKYLSTVDSANDAEAIFISGGTEPGIRIKGFVNNVN